MAPHAARATNETNRAALAARGSGAAFRCTHAEYGPHRAARLSDCGDDGAAATGCARRRGRCAEPGGLREALGGIESRRGRRSRIPGSASWYLLSQLTALGD